MKKILFSVISAFALAGLLFLTACPQNADNNVTIADADTSALQAKIAEAERENDATVVSRSNGYDVPLGTFWVEQRTKNEFTTAIATAKGVLKAPISQNNVDNATSALGTKIEQFKNARKPGSGDPVNKTDLMAAIAKAESEKAQTVVAASAGEVAQGMYWVTSQVMTAFETAITAAKNALSSAVTQEAVDSAKNTLDSAISTFTSASQGGTKTSGFTQAELTALIASANAAKAGVKTSEENGDDVSPAQYWVTQYTLGLLNTAIITAQGATGSGIDNAYLDLVSALNAFNAVKDFGSPTETVKGALFSAIRYAYDDIMTGVAVAASASQAPLGSQWATEEQWLPLNTAYNNAIAAAADPNATVNDVAAKTEALTAAVNVFTQAVSDNGLGEKQNTVTINGLSSFDGTDIYIFLLSTPNLIGGEPQVYGSGTVENGSAAVDLYTGEYAWAGGGSWFVFFAVGDEDEQAIYVSKTAINFTANPDAVTNFTDYKRYVFSISFGELAENMGSPAPAAGITLDAWCQETFGKTWTQMLATDDIPGRIYKNEGLTAEFTGSDILYPNTIIYSTFSLTDGGSKIGEISGTITLTNINSSPPRVYLSAYGDGWEGREIELSPVSGSTATVSWTLPIFGNGNEYFPSEGSFRLWVVPPGSSRDKGFYVFPESQSVSGPNAGGISLGSASIAYITLSGTLTVTYDNKPVPYVKIRAISTNDDGSDWIDLASPVANASWSITLPAFNSPTTVRFTVTGVEYNEAEDRWETLFFKSVQPSNTSNVSNQSITGINLDLGNILNANTPVTPVSLTADTWVNGTIADSGDVDWYSISVTNGTKYYLWWNDSWAGNKSKTLDVEVYAYKNNSGDEISLDNNDDAWNDPVSFTASSNGTVFVRVRHLNGGYGTGTYAIVYSTNNSRPVGGDGTRENPFLMNANTWVSGNIPAGGEQWFSFTATAYQQFIHVKFDTLTDLCIESYYPDYNWYDDFLNLWGSGTAYTDWNLNSGQEYYIRVWPSSSDNGGTYQIAFNESTRSPDYVISNEPGGEGNPLPLTANTWTVGNITSSTPNGELWYSFDATERTTYYVWWNDTDGDWTYEFDVTVNAYNTDDSLAFSEDGGWFDTNSLTAVSNGKIKLRVQQRYDNTGSFAIVYNTSGNRPNN